MSPTPSPTLDSSERPWLLLSTLQHFAYCPRQASLILDGVWSDNHLTVSGDVAHERVDQVGTDHRRGIRAHHHVELVCRRLWIRGVGDTVEEGPNGVLTPVEHKLGRGTGDLTPSIVQVVAQALCLEEMTGRSVEEAVVYVVGERRREVIKVSEYREFVEGVVDQAREELEDTVAAPVFEARRCRSCSVLGSCQPKGWLL